MKFRYYVRRTSGFLGLALGMLLLFGALYGIYSASRKHEDVTGFIVMLGFSAVCLYGAARWILDQGHGLEHLSPNLNIPGLAGSVAKSKKSISVFVGAVVKNHDRAFIKFPIACEGEFTEHIWGYVHSIQGGVFSVSPANDPIHNGILGDERIRIDQDAVEDWMLLDKEGKIRGGFSLIAIFEHFERTGKWISPRMRSQRALLLDAPPTNGI